MAIQRLQNPHSIIITENGEQKAHGCANADYNSYYHLDAYGLQITLALFPLWPRNRVIAAAIYTHYVFDDFTTSASGVDVVVGIAVHVVDAGYGCGNPNINHD